MPEYNVGSRSAAITLSLDVYHRDVMDLLKIQHENRDPRLTAFDIFPQLVVNDVFMRRVEANLHWTLLDPKEVLDKTGYDLSELVGDEFEKAYLVCEATDRLRLKTVVKARDIVKEMMRSWVETGLPYVAFKDTINAVNPNKNTGYIPGANLCVHPDTKILTRDGNKTISSLEDMNVQVWNGDSWSTTTVMKTGTNQEMLDIGFSDYSNVKCTPYHKFYVMSNYRSSKEVQAKDLVIGDKLVKFELDSHPVDHGDKTLTCAYTQGFYSGDGSGTDTKCSISLYGAKIGLLKYLDARSIGNIEKEVTVGGKDRRKILLNTMEPKEFVPSSTYTIQTRINWLAGLIDADGHNQNDNLVVSSNKLSFLLDIKLLLQELGCHSSISINYPEGIRSMPNNKGGNGEYMCKAVYRLIMGKQAVNRLLDLGLDTHRVVVNGTLVSRDTRKYITVTSVAKADNSDTYCFNEPINHKGVFNGHLLGNCVESYSNVKAGHTSHVCNLSSLNLSDMSMEEAGYYARICTRMLDNAIELTDFPTEASAIHNDMYRVIGVGVMGLADWIAKEGLTYSSVDDVGDLMETISYNTVVESIQLATERGSFTLFPESEWANGNMIERYATMSNVHNWIRLQDEIDTYGIRNSQLMAIAPNTSTSLIQGCSASVLPVYKKMFFDTNSSGTFPIVAKHIKDRFWNYIEYKNMDNIKMNSMISEIQKWVDTGISYETVFDMNKGITAKDMFNFFMDAWRKKIKTIYYVRIIGVDGSMKDKEECTSCAG